MTEQNVDLIKVFSQVSKALKTNQQSLNDADTYNHDHGDHMVETFNTITKAMKSQKGSDPSQLLNYAAQQLSQNANNGSAQLYSQGLQAAADQFTGQNVDTQSALSLLQTVLGGGQTSTAQSNQSASGGVGDLLGSLLGGGQSDSGANQQAGGGLLGSLLGGLTGGTQQQSGGGFSDGLDVGDLVTAGMAFFQAKQQGKTGMNALIDAFVAASGMGSDPHRQQSTQLVASTFMNAIGKMGK